MKIELGKVCLYTHSIKGKVFYVGVGVSVRPFVTAKRSSKWREVVTRHGFYEVRILAWFSRKAQALQLEQQLIKELKPEANLMHSGRPFRSEEFKQRAKEFNTGRRISDQTRAKISSSKSGVSTYNKGKPALNRKAVLNLETGEIYPSVKACAATLHITAKRIRRAVETGIDKTYRLANYIP